MNYTILIELIPASQHSIAQVVDTQVLYKHGAVKFLGTNYDMIVTKTIINQYSARK